MIHPTAIIDKSVEIGQNVEIGPFVYIGKGCVIGDNVKIGAHAVVECFTEIGNDCNISPNAHIGGAPQDISYKGEDTRLKIGNRCVIREFATIHRASTKEDWETVLGDNCYIMAYSHIAHDCKIGNNVVITNFAGLAGHVWVDDYAIISGHCGIHQFVRIGKMAMVAAMSGVLQDVPPFVLVEGTPAIIKGLNIVGLRRRNINSETRLELKKILKLYLSKSSSQSDLIQKMKSEAKSKESKEFIKFIENTRRGVIRR